MFTATPKLGFCRAKFFASKILSKLKAGSEVWGLALHSKVLTLHDKHWKIKLNFTFDAVSPSFHFHG